MIWSTSEKRKSSSWWSSCVDILSIPTQENMFKMHVLVSTMGCHVQTLVLNKNTKVMFFVIVALITLNQTIYHLMAKTIKHFLLYFPSCFNFSFYSKHFSFVLLPPEKVEKLKKLLISYSAGDRHSLLEILLQFKITPWLIIAFMYW